MNGLLKIKIDYDFSSKLKSFSLIFSSQIPNLDMTMLTNLKSLVLKEDFCYGECTKNRKHKSQNRIRCYDFAFTKSVSYLFT